MIATQAVSTSPPHLHVVSPQLHPQALPQHQNNQHQHPAAQRPTVLRLNSAPAPATTSTPVTMLGAHIHPNELRVMEAIAGLCSQHHMSSYSVMKFGERGCPTAYIPLSVVAPAHVEELQKRQTLNMAVQLYYPANRTDQSATAIAEASTAAQTLDHSNGIVQVTAVETSTFLTLGGRDAATTNTDSAIHSPEPRPATSATPFDFASFNPLAPPPPALLRTRSEPIIHPPPSPQLNEALALAISSALTPQPLPFTPKIFGKSAEVRVTSSAPQPAPTNGPMPSVLSEGPAPPKPKTSETHPINISYVLPHNLITQISAHLAAADPSVFESALNEEDSVPPSLNSDDCDDRDAAYETLPSINLPLHLRLDTCFGPVHQPLHTHTLPLRASATHAPSLAMVPPLTSMPPPAQMDLSPEATIAAQTSIREAISEALQPFTPVRVPVHYTTSDSRPRSSNPAEAPNPPPFPTLPYPLMANMSPYATQTLPTHLPPVPQLGARFQPGPVGPQIGNLLLSSCPGKKVRLSGPVKGRGAICRSLPQDLARIRSLGVGLIINCLDNTELEFLGAPWPEYASCAGQLGIDVLRIPTPEGLAPLDVAKLDRAVDWVIRRYTLRGVNVLVHCRGGVGRAGLVACSWTIKMGLCGPVSEALQALWENSEPSMPATIPWKTLISHGVLRRESFQLVERVVLTLRRRRSMKAIETYEQARFLVDFVEHLRETQEERMREALAMRDSSKLDVDAGATTAGSVSPISNRSLSSGANTDETMVEIELPDVQAADGLKAGDTTPVDGGFKIHVAQSLT
ncbi:hypothetical protein FRC04_004309 [Tulasnella sp. 424]|nr:hypothetical protein FRC04_004309 [Tulasnella sp. 424]KAG8979429.1 hypothetical protein FRC05_008415 [Tulasnella sp. 425]